MNRLRLIRLTKNITQLELGLLSRIHQPKISLIERGLVVPTESEKKRLADALNVSVVEIFGGDPS